jgi:hypothetical protein
MRERMATKAKRVKIAESIEIGPSTGNVFEDLGLPDAESPPPGREWAQRSTDRGGRALDGARRP